MDPHSIPIDDALNRCLIGVDRAVFSLHRLDDGDGFFFLATNVGTRSDKDCTSGRQRRRNNGERFHRRKLPNVVDQINFPVTIL